LHELVHGHLQGEDDRGDLVHDRGAHGAVQGEGGLAHGGPPGDDDQVRGLVAGGEFVEFVVARVHASDQLAAAGAFLQLQEDLVHQCLAVHVGAAGGLLRDGEHGLLGFVQQLVHGQALVEAAGDDRGGGVDELALDRFVPHDAGVVQGVGRAHDRLGQLGEVHLAAHLIERARLVQPLGHRHQVDGRVLGVAFVKRVENCGVSRVVEILWPKNVHQGVEDGGVVENPPQNRLLSFQILGGDFAQDVSGGGFETRRRRLVRAEATRAEWLARLTQRRRQPRPQPRQGFRPRPGSLRRRRTGRGARP